MKKIIFTLLCCLALSACDVPIEQTEAYSQGYEAGYEKGYQDGHDDGESDGYDAGYKEAEFDYSEEIEAYTPNDSTQSQSNTELFYIGNMNTKVYHRPKCPSVEKMNTLNKRKDSKENLLADGYTPCHNCNP